MGDWYYVNIKHFLNMNPEISLPDGFTEVPKGFELLPNKLDICFYYWSVYKKPNSIFNSTNNISNIYNWGLYSVDAYPDYTKYKQDIAFMIYKNIKTKLGNIYT